MKKFMYAVSVSCLLALLMGCASHHTSTQTNVGYGVIQSVKSVRDHNWHAGKGTEVGIGVGALLGGLAGGVVGVAVTVASFGLGGTSIPAFMAGGAAIGGVSAGLLGYGVDQAEKPEYVEQYQVLINRTNQTVSALDHQDSPYTVGSTVRVYEVNGQYRIAQD